MNFGLSAVLDSKDKCVDHVDAVDVDLDCDEQMSRSLIRAIVMKDHCKGSPFYTTCK